MVYLGPAIRPQGLIMDFSDGLAQITSVRGQLKALLHASEHQRALCH